MSIELSNKEKIDIIDTKISFFNQQIFNFEIDLELKNSEEEKDQAQIDYFNKLITETNNKINLLNTIRDTLI